jgi:hypothetical protein
LYRRTTWAEGIASAPKFG